MLGTLLLAVRGMIAGGKRRAKGERNIWPAYYMFLPDGPVAVSTMPLNRPRIAAMLGFRLG